jgi:hypothetical protein
MDFATQADLDIYLRKHPKAIENIDLHRVTPKEISDVKRSAEDLKEQIAFHKAQLSKFIPMRNQAIDERAPNMKDWGSLTGAHASASVEFEHALTQLWRLSYAQLGLPVPQATMVENPKNIKRNLQTAGRNGNNSAHHAELLEKQLGVH